MSGWKSRLRSSSATPKDITMATTDEEAMVSLKLSWMEALDDNTVINKLQSALKSIFTPLTDAINHLRVVNTSLQQELVAKDETIHALQQKVETLEVAMGDLEQHGRKGSMRIFGLPEDTSGQVDEKVLSLVNNHLKLQPPIVLEDIEDHEEQKKPEGQSLNPRIWHPGKGLHHWWPDQEAGQTGISNTLTKALQTLSGCLGWWL